MVATFPQRTDGAAWPYHGAGFAAPRKVRRLSIHRDDWDEIPRRLTADFAGPSSGRGLAGWRNPVARVRRGWCGLDQPLGELRTGPGVQELDGPVGDAAAGGGRRRDQTPDPARPATCHPRSQRSGSGQPDPARPPRGQPDRKPGPPRMGTGPSARLRRMITLPPPGPAVAVSVPRSPGLAFLTAGRGAASASC